MKLLKQSLNFKYTFLALFAFKFSHNQVYWIFYPTIDGHLLHDFLFKSSKRFPLEADSIVVKLRRIWFELGWKERNCWQENMRLIIALAFVLLVTVVYANPLFEEMSDGEDEDGDVQLNDLAENDDDSIDENDDDERMKNKVASI